MKCLQIRDYINNILYIVSDNSRYHSNMTIFLFKKKKNINALKHKILYCPTYITTLKLKHE